MKPSVYCICLGFCLTVNVVLQGGDLNPPPGPISPTMKKLDIVEPRTPIVSLPYTITQSGSYYLTGSLTGIAGQNGITLVASDVTIDLMGFTLQGVPGSLDGIGMSMLPITVSNVTVRNGTVRDWGGNGATLGGYVHLEEVSFSSNAGHGAVIGSYSYMEEVSFASNGGTGAQIGSYVHMEEVSFTYNVGKGVQIGDFAHMEEVTIVYNGGGGAVIGMSAEMEDVSFCYNTGNGLEARDNCIITRCTAEGNTMDGLVVGESVSMTDVVAADNGGRGVVLVRHDKRGPAILSAVRTNGNGGDGIILGENAMCTGCVAVDNLGRGIVADKSSPKLIQAYAVGNTGGDGIVVGSGALLENCTSRSNSGNGVVARESPTTAVVVAEGNASLSRGAGGAQGAGVISQGNGLDGFVIGPGSKLTDCQALNNGGNGLTVTDDNVPPNTSTVVLRGCVARANGNMGFKIVLPPPVTPPSANTAAGPTLYQPLASNVASSGPMPVEAEKEIAAVSLRPARGASLVLPLASVRFAGTGFACVAEENVGDGFYLDGSWMLSECVARNNGGVGINSWSWGEAQTSIAEGNVADGFVFHGGFKLTDCTSRGNGGVGINSYSFGIGKTSTAVGNGLDGFVVTSGSMVTGCVAQGNGTTGLGSGIRVTGTGNRLEGNHLLGNHNWGLSLLGGGNLVIGNSASGNTGGNYNIPSGNAAAPIVTTTDVVTNISPNANYDY